MNLDSQTIFVVVDDKGEIFAAYSEMNEDGYCLIENSDMRVVETTLWTLRTGK